MSECLLDNSGNRDTVSELDMSELTECRKTVVISTLSAHACLSTANHVTDREGRHCCYKIVLDSLQCLYTTLYVLVCCILCKYFLRRLSSFLIKHTYVNV